MPETTVKFNCRFAEVLGVLAAGFLLAPTAQAAATSGLSCPSFHGKVGLSQVELSDGPPSENAWLAPEVSMDGKDGHTNRWIMAPNPRGYWARCHYGRSVIDLKLPSGLRQCTIRYDKAQKVLRNGLQPSCR
jgi:hypothetical protein